MLVCPSCGCANFSAEVSTRTTLASASIGEEFGIISGEVTTQNSSILNLVCDKCGEGLRIDKLEKARFCYECGAPVGKLYREDERGNVYHPKCAYNVLGEEESKPIYDPNI